MRCPSQSACSTYLSQSTQPQANLVRLKLELSRILDYVEQLNQLDVSGVEATAQVVTSARQAVRDDRVSPRTGSSEAGKTVKFFKVPKVIER